MIEEVVRLGRHDSLLGIMTRDGASAGETGVLLLNAGLIHRVGPHRLYVRLARMLATEGFPVVRFDFPGIGDSAERWDSPRFEDGALQATREVMDSLVSRGTCRRFVLAGICLGAEISFRAADVDPRVLGAVLINAPRYRAEPSLALIRSIQRRQRAHYYWRVALFKPALWRRLMGDTSRGMSVLRAAAASLQDVLRGPYPTVEAGNDDQDAFERLRERGVRLLLLFSGGDRGLHYLQAMVGRRRLWRWRSQGNPHLTVIKRTDHIMTMSPSQERCLQVVRRWARALPRS